MPGAHGLHGERRAHRAVHPAAHRDDDPAASQRLRLQSSSPRSDIGARGLWRCGRHRVSNDASTASADRRRFIWSTVVARAPHPFSRRLRWPRSETGIALACPGTLVATPRPSIHGGCSLSFDISGAPGVAPPPLNAALLLWQSAARSGDRAAIVERGSIVSYTALRERAALLGAALRTAGIGADDRVAIRLGGGRDAAAAFFGTLAAGAIAVVVNETLC